jgi:glucosamine-6-phosphate deaminase
MRTEICADKIDLGHRAAADGARLIRAAVAAGGRANIIVATGASQFEMLSALTQEPDVPWHKVTAFHLDEYAGMPISHPASFRKYLWERFVSKLPLPLAAFHYIDAERDPAGECLRLGRVIRQHPIDVAFIGIGENAHIAFNDPPADFSTEEPYIVVALDEACRRQQLGEGWFPTLDDVPTRAVSMSVNWILRSREIVCSVPDERKAKAVHDTIRGEITPTVPASILQRHERTTIYLDPPAASMLSGTSAPAV